MPFLPAGSCSFVRFAVDSNRPRLFGPDEVDALIARRAGSRGVKRNATGAEYGWAAGAHVLDSGEACFDLEKQVYPDHLAWDLCVKTEKLPAELMEAYYLTELKALAKENPSGLPSNRQKKEAKTAARERLENQAKDGRFEKFKRHNLLWDAVSNELFVGATASGPQDMALDLFHETFNREATMITPGTLALKKYPDAANEQMSAFLPGVSPDRPTWAPNELSPDFLGNEFLIWLWFYTQTEPDGDTIKLEGQSEVTFFFSGGVKVEDPKAISGNDTMNSDSAIRLPESLVAIGHGKLPRKAALTLMSGDEKYSFVLRAADFAVTSCVLPKPPADMKEPRPKLEHRLQALHDLAGLIDGLYGVFLARRFGLMWAAELANMQSWLRAAAREKGAKKK